MQKISNKLSGCEIKNRYRTVLSKVSNNDFDFLNTYRTFPQSIHSTLQRLPPWSQLTLIANKNVFNRLTFGFHDPPPHTHTPVLMPDCPYSLSERIYFWRVLNEMLQYCIFYLRYVSLSRSARFENIERLSMKRYVVRRRYSCVAGHALNAWRECRGASSHFALLCSTWR